VTTVQAACFIDADLTRSAHSISHVREARPSERKERTARYNRKSCAPISDLLLPALQTADPLCQSLQFLLIQHFVVHHTDQKLLDRSAAEPVDNLPYRTDGYVLRRR